MSKIKELFGVEIGERFDIKDEIGEIFKNCYFNGSGALFRGENEDSRSYVRLLLLGELIMGKAKIVKIKTPILTPDEHDYLQAVCKPYDIDYIYKDDGYLGTSLYIAIRLKNGETISLPYFPNSSAMYKGMELDKDYTPEELGIKL